MAKPFPKGNKLAKGGKRRNSGRRTDAQRAAFSGAIKDLKPAALAFLHETLNDPRGYAKDRLKAAEIVLKYTEKLPEQDHNVNAAVKLYKVGVEGEDDGPSDPTSGV